MRCNKVFQLITGCVCKLQFSVTINQRMSQADFLFCRWFRALFSLIMFSLSVDYLQAQSERWSVAWKWSSENIFFNTRFLNFDECKKYKREIRKHFWRDINIRKWNRTTQFVWESFFPLPIVLKTTSFFFWKPHKFQKLFFTHLWHRHE